MVRVYIILNFSSIPCHARDFFLFSSYMTQDTEHVPVVLSNPRLWIVSIILCHQVPADVGQGTWLKQIDKEDTSYMLSKCGNHTTVNRALVVWLNEVVIGVGISSKTGKVLKENVNKGCLFFVLHARQDEFVLGYKTYSGLSLQGMIHFALWKGTGVYRGIQGV